MECFRNYRVVILYTSQSLMQNRIHRQRPRSAHALLEMFLPTATSLGSQAAHAGTHRGWQGPLKPSHSKCSIFSRGFTLGGCHALPKLAKPGFLREKKRVSGARKPLFLAFRIAPVSKQIPISRRFVNVEKARLPAGGGISR